MKTLSRIMSGLIRNSYHRGLVSVSLIAFLAAGLTGFSANAGELDGEKTISTEQIQLAKYLPKTVVVRTKADGTSAEVVHLSNKLSTDEKTRDAINSLAFTKIDERGHSGTAVSELDRDSSSSSWYFYYHSHSHYYYPTYYYYGYWYNYSSYYSYYYSGYYYSYYGWPHYY